MIDSGKAFVGLDVSLTNTGVCIKCGDDIELHNIKTTPKTAPHDISRMNHIVRKVTDLIPGDVVLICVEDYFTPHNLAQVNAAIRLIGLGTLLRHRMYYDKQPFYVIPPTQLKKFVTGKGNAQKNMVMLDVYKKWNIDVADDNQADACVLAHMAEALHRWPSENGMAKYQSEVIKKITKEGRRFN